jgi:hydroxymethylpyrimidine pyrophosphatase-like HAD family hydrolase
MTMDKAILVDVDGTVALHNGRDPFDWEKLSEDLPNKPVVEVINIVGSTGVRLIFVTGREDKYRIETEKWLMQYVDVPFSLYCRTTDDFRSDEEIKKEIYEKNIEGKYHVIGVFDDRNRVVSMWREKLGLVCFQVSEGNF